jgi:integrase
MAKQSTKTADHTDDHDRVLQDHELDRLREYVHTKADEARRKGSTRAIVDELLFVLLADAGLKPKEVCDLNISDIPAHQKSGKLHIRLHPASRNRHVQVSNQTTDLINVYAQVHRQGARHSAPLLLSERGNRFGYISIYNKIRRLGEKVNLERLHPNTLRKTYMLRLFQKEQNIRLVQQQAGHASHKTTIQYLKSSIDLHSGPCDVCGHQIPGNTGKRIDSGHLLCSQCFNAFQRKAKG